MDYLKEFLHEQWTSWVFRGVIAAALTWVVMSTVAWAYSRMDERYVKRSEHVVFESATNANFTKQEERVDRRLSTIEQDIKELLRRKDNN